MDDLIAFITARLNETERTVYAEGDPPHGVIAWLTFEDSEGQLLYTAAAHGDTPDGPWIAKGREVTPSRPPLIVYDPARVLREVAAMRAIASLHRIDEESYLDGDGIERPGHHCRECAWEEWPCPTLRHLGAVWSDHPDYREERAPRP